MTAWMKTNILKREEKGLGPVSLPRVLLSGFAGVFVVLTLSRIAPFVLGCLSGVLVTILVVVLTQPVGSLSVAQFLVKSAAALLVVRARRRERRSVVLNVLNLDPDEAVVDCDGIFSLRAGSVQEEPAELPPLIFFGDTDGSGGDDLLVLDDPFGASMATAGESSPGAAE